MIFTASEVSSASKALARWEIGEYFCEAIVILGCAGEYIAEFSNCFTSGNRKRKDALAKKSILVLIIGLTLGIICLFRTNQLSGTVIESLGDKAEAADKKAEKAVTDSGTAQHKADEANTAAGDALGKSKAAEDASEHALTLARSTEKYAAWRKISEKQVEIIVKHLASLKSQGHTLEMFVFTTDPETVAYAERLGTVLNAVMKVHLSSYPGKFLPPPGLSFTVGKDREKDFALIVEALDMTGVEKASALRKTAEHRGSDDSITVNIGGKH